jgi:hypothetical protein
MAQTGYTPILLYATATASSVPTAANLTSTPTGAELAINYTDGKLYYKDNTGTVQLLASKAVASISLPLSPANGGTGQTSLPLSPANGGTGQTSLAAANIALFNTTQTWTAGQLFNGSTATFAASLGNAAETVSVVAGAINSTPTAYINSGAVAFYTSSATANWTQNLSFSSGTTLNSALAVGQSATIAILATQGSTPYYMNGTLTIDGSSSGVTTYWQNGSAPASGNASGIDVYTYTIIKTGGATYTVLATQTQF